MTPRPPDADAGGHPVEAGVVARPHGLDGSFHVARPRAQLLELGARVTVAGLVLANSGGLVGLTKNTRRACLLFSRIFAAGSRGAWWYKALFAQFYRSVLPAPAARDQRQRIVECAYETAPVLAEAWRGFADAAQSDHRALAIALDVPVLFAWAMQDRINSFADAEPTIHHMKRAEVIKFQGGHAAFLEQPEQFAAAFDRFAREILETRDTPALPRIEVADRIAAFGARS